MTGAAHRPRVLTWPVHGAYLSYLSAADVELLVISEEGLVGYPPSVVSVEPGRLSSLDADVVLYQSHGHWAERERLLPRHLLALPSVIVEHDPPRGHPTDTRHPAADQDVLLVHVTHYNALMWDAGSTPTLVIEHGVPDPGVRYDGRLERGIVVINGLHWRGRRLGRDLFEAIRREVPLDLVGMESELLGGLGEVKPGRLPEVVAQYRFFFSPMRYTSLGLAILEAMAIGVPVVGLPTTELPRVIRDGENGFLGSNRDELVTAMRRLLADHDLARRVGEEGRRTVRDRYGVERFGADWTGVLTDAADGRFPLSPPTASSGASSVGDQVR